MNPKVDFYFNQNDKWQDEVRMLRSLVVHCGLTEDLKWGCPCYTCNEANIVLIHTFKDYCALLFFKGSLLKDAQGILIQQTENVQVRRQLRFTDSREINGSAATIKAYIFEAIEVEKAGLQAELKQTADFALPEQFKQRLDAEPALQAAFKALTPGRQRAYLLHFAQPKQAKTREDRIDKWAPQILNGKGLND